MKKNIMRKKILTILALTTLVGAMPTATSAQGVSELYERGCELMDMGRWSDARVELIEAKELCGMTEYLQQQRIDYALTLCDAKLGKRSSEEELALFMELYPQAPYNNEILFLRGIIKASNEEEAEAMKLLEEVDPKRLSKRDRERYNIRMAYLSFQKGNYNKSQAYLAKIEAESAFNPHAIYCKSYIAYVDNKYAEAKGGFETLLKDDLFKPIAPYYLLQIEFLMGNYNKAVEYGTGLLASSLAQRQVYVVRTLAEAHFRLEEYDKALDLIEKYESAGGELGREEFYIKGFSLHQLGRYIEAIEPLKKVCGADDEMTQNASLHLANCYLHTDDKSGARSAFSMAANDKFNKQIAEEALFNYAKLQYELGDGRFNEAVNLLTRYVTTYKNPERLSTAHTLLVAAYYNTRDYAAAYDNIALIKEPDAEVKAAKQKITYLRGLEQYNKGDYKRAAQYLDESIKIGVTAKQIALASYWMGETKFLQGDYDKAVALYNDYLLRAPKNDPITTEAQYSIAYAMLMQGNSQSAAEYFKRYVAATNTVPALRADAYNRLGDIYYGARNFTAAAESYKKTIWSRSKASNYARYQVAIINGVLGKPQAKITELSKITSPAEGEEYLDDALYELGRSYIGVEQYQDAITSHKSFLKLYPSSPFYAQALSDLGVAYINTGDTKSSLDYYDRAIKAAPQSQIAKDAMQGIREIHVGRGDAEAYFKYAESIGMEGDLNTVTRDSLSFASARGLYFAGDKSKSKMKSAAVALEGYVEKYPKGYYLNDALFFLSDSYIKMGDSKKAIEALERLGERGQSQYSESLYSKLSTICFDEGEYAKAAKASRSLYDVAKNKKTKHEAMSMYIDAVVKVGDESLTIKASDDILALGEANVGKDATQKANYQRATALRKRGEREKALKIYEMLAAGDSEFKSEARYYIIENLYRVGKREEATDMIFKFSEQQGVDPYWLAKGFILLGDIYVAAEDSFQARATYQSIVDGYSNQSDGIIEEAKRKIGELK